MKIKGTFILREIAGDYVLIPTGDTALHFNGMITLSKTSAMIWKAIEEGKSEDTIVKMILDTFEIDEETAKCDVHEFIKNMSRAGFIE